MTDVLCVGHAAYDITMSTSRHCGADEKMQADSMQLSGGGPAANAAVTVTRLGGTAAFCGYLGNDLFGDAHMAEFEAAGVDTLLIMRGPRPSPVSAILSKPDGTRAVVNYKGDTPWLEPNAVDPLSVQPKVMLLDGHEPLLSVPLVKWAREQHIPTVLDAGSDHKGTRELAPLVDYLVASSRFAYDWCGTEHMDAALQQLSELAPHVVITLGGHGLVWASDGKAGALPAFGVAAVDTTGAGDAFHGAFALGVAQGMEWDALLRFSSAAGALACTRLGARSGIPSASEVTALLGNSKAKPLSRQER
ncbi:MAG: carbohydrate kinase family protein [Mariprofundaceae bacterium]